MENDDHNLTHLIWSNEHRGWWKPNSRGYTKDLLQAGLYSQEQARKITSDSSYWWKTEGSFVITEELPVCIADLPSNMQKKIWQAQEQRDNKIS